MLLAPFIQNKTTFFILCLWLTIIDLSWFHYTAFSPPHFSFAVVVVFFQGFFIEKLFFSFHLSAVIDWPCFFIVFKEFFAREICPHLEASLFRKISISVSIYKYHWDMCVNNEREKWMSGGGCYMVEYDNVVESIWWWDCKIMTWWKNDDDENFLSLFLSLS